MVSQLTDFISDGNLLSFRNATKRLPSSSFLRHRQNECDMLKRRRGHTHLSPRNFSVPALRDAKKVGKDTQWHGPNPGSFDEVAMCVEIVVDGNLDEIARHMRTTCKEDLRSRVRRWGSR